MDYPEYVRNWLNGIFDEISFWENYMKNKGGCFSANFEWTVQKNKRFTLEDDIDDDKECSFIDIGSGPFSRCGYITEKSNLKVSAVDPLGAIYEKMKNKYKLQNGIIVDTGFVECLDKYSADNQFDIVHMSNSLDHSFDPMYGIYQMLRICKIGYYC